MENDLGSSPPGILELAEKWLITDERVALATVIATWGSSPFPVGSQLLVNKEGDFVGSVSGGCVEGEVIRESLKTLEDNSPRILKFSVTNDAAWDVGLACGGTVRIYLERIERSFVETIKVLMMASDERRAIYTNHSLGHRRESALGT